MPGGGKRSKSETHSQKLLFIINMYDLLLPPGISVLKGRTVKEKSFSKFLILVAFKETLIQTNTSLL